MTILLTAAPMQVPEPIALVPVDTHQIPTYQPEPLQAVPPVTVGTSPHHTSTLSATATLAAAAAQAIAATPPQEPPQDCNDISANSDQTQIYNKQATSDVAPEMQPAPTAAIVLNISSPPPMLSQRVAVPPMLSERLIVNQSSSSSPASPSPIPSMIPPPVMLAAPVLAGPPAGMPPTYPAPALLSERVGTNSPPDGQPPGIPLLINGPPSGIPPTYAAPPPITQRQPTS